jgi:ElaB/YqjD/DUF883 family membrane-anchored ribosome-binding protein
MSMTDDQTTQDAFGTDQGNGKMKENLKHLGDQAKTQFRSASEKMQRSAEDMNSKLQEQVRERPTMAIGLAAGAGVLIGMLLASRR